MARCLALISLMNATGKTLEEFAVFSGVSKSTLLRYRAGKSHVPRDREIMWLANALEVDRDWLRAIVVEAAKKKPVALLTSPSGSTTRKAPQMGAGHAVKITGAADCGAALLTTLSEFIERWPEIRETLAKR